MFFASNKHARVGVVGHARLAQRRGGHDGDVVACDDDAAHGLGLVELDDKVDWLILMHKKKKIFFFARIWTEDEQCTFVRSVRVRGTL